jgi:hypothetical protein
MHARISLSASGISAASLNLAWRDDIDAITIAVYRSFVVICRSACSHVKQVAKGPNGMKPTNPNSRTGSF